MHEIKLPYKLSFFKPVSLHASARTYKHKIIKQRGQCRNLHLGIPEYRLPKVISNHFRPLVTDSATTFHQSTLEAAVPCGLDYLRIFSFTYICYLKLPQGSNVLPCSMWYHPVNFVLLIVNDIRIKKKTLVGKTR